MRLKDVIKELYKCNDLKCQGCHLNIKVPHGFDCAARMFGIDEWKDRLTSVLNPKFSKYSAFLEVIELHEKNKQDCNLCPLYDAKYNFCELKHFRDRQLLLRAMRDAEESDVNEQQTGRTDTTGDSTKVN